MKKMIQSMDNNGCACSRTKKIAAVLGVILIAAGLGAGVCRMMCCGTKTMVIDFDRVQQEATAYKAILDQQKEYEAQVQAQLAQAADALAAEEKALVDRKSSMKEAEFKKETMALQQKALDLQNRYRGLFQQIGRASQLAAAQIQESVEETLQKVARRAGAGVVLNKAMTVHVGTKNDLTDCLIKALNKSVKPVAYPNPSNMNPEGGQ